MLRKRNLFSIVLLFFMYLFWNYFLTYNFTEELRIGLRHAKNITISSTNFANSNDFLLKEIESSVTVTDKSDLNGFLEHTLESYSDSNDEHFPNVNGKQDIMNNISSEPKVKHQPMHKSSDKERSEPNIQDLPSHIPAIIASKPKPNSHEHKAKNSSTRKRNAHKMPFEPLLNEFDEEENSTSIGNQDSTNNMGSEDESQQKVMELIQQTTPNPTSGQDSKSVEMPGIKESFMLTRTPVALVLSTVRVEFSLLTTGDHQFVAFYSPSRAMTIAQRTLGNATWKFKELSSKIGWDNHNWIVLGLDETGCLHVSGNVHASPLVYYRASKPLDIDSLERKKTMVGDGSWKYMEYQTTYPLFLNTPNGELVYYYRHGMSMSGGTVMNIYNATARAWRRMYGGDGLLITGMTDSDRTALGPKDMNPYTSLRRGPDGRYHLIWLWRDNADARSCHHLCYARSRDLRLWETADGRPLATPIIFNYTEQVHFLAMPVVSGVPFLPQAGRSGIS